MNNPLKKTLSFANVSPKILNKKSYAMRIFLYVFLFEIIDKSQFLQPLWQDDVKLFL